MKTAPPADPKLDGGIFHTAGEYYARVDGKRVYVARNEGMIAHVHGSFANTAANRERCVGYANRQAAREAAGHPAPFARLC